MGVSLNGGSPKSSILIGFTPHKFPIVTYFCSLQSVAHSVVQHLGSKKPWETPPKKKHPGNSRSWRWSFGWGVHMFIKSSKMSRLTQKRPLQWPQAAKIVGHQKIEVYKHSYRHHGDVHSHHTLCGLFFTAGYRYTGPGHTMCLYFVFWTNHMLAPHPGKPKNTNGGLKNSKAPFRGSFFNS